MKRTRTKESTALFLISTQKAMSKYEIVNKFICEFITIWQACNLESLIYQMKLCKQRNGRNLEIPYFPITGQKLWKFADVSGLSLSLSTIPFLQDVPNPPKKSDIIYGSIVLSMKYVKLIKFIFVFQPQKKNLMKMRPVMPRMTPLKNLKMTLLKNLMTKEFACEQFCTLNLFFIIIILSVYSSIEIKFVPWMTRNQNVYFFIKTSVGLYFNLKAVSAKSLLL